ncbi:hypothetical protein J31TS4_38010 [Paenibacillus sp. J31TS4]|uniref:MGMT family protein n=1 Tax=Paenibacillus sp. J31TS4 TaxID=2807195 RepID=UPI001B0EEC7A|nr:MGMT family protein [Paenibacillus sp. J31TS4]GIP40521.1 hypothetical protein J31TS4_38010 [Paenibacillus sp. J31TS4]
MQPFTERVVGLIGAIPAGHVMTYGQIAALAGSPRGARQVVRILHSLSAKHGLPWHRVVNGKGEVAIREDESRFVQMMLLSDEGVETDDRGRLDLGRYQYHPGQDAPLE